VFVRCGVVPGMTRGEYVGGATLVHGEPGVNPERGRVRAEPGPVEGRRVEAPRVVAAAWERQALLAQNSSTRAFHASGCSKYGE
jgi:hypothetical protein